MNLLAAITESTCGEACWEAREDVCRCSCNGANHGCTRSGIIPERTSKIDGYMYKLIAVGEYRDIEGQGRELSKDAGERYLYHCLSTRRAPFRTKPASKSQIERWHELETYRNLSRLELYKASPRLLWEHLIPA